MNIIKLSRLLATVLTVSSMVVALTLPITYAAQVDPGGAGGTTGRSGSGSKPIEGCRDIKTSLIECKTDSGTPIMGIIIQLINFLAVGVGIAVVGGIIWGGMLYASSNGDPSKTKQGVTVIINAVVGLLLFMFMYAIINYLVPGGVFN